jgi:hypothetical protein
MKGKNKSAKVEKLDMAKKLLALNVDIPVVKEKTGLTWKEIQALEILNWKIA